MFASRAIRSTRGGHPYTSSSVKFKITRPITQDEDDRRRISEMEEETHPKRSLACAFVSFLFCPILGFVALYYGIRSVHAHHQGFYAEATPFYKKSLRWSLITFILGLVIGSIITLIFFVKGVVSI